MLSEKLDAPLKGTTLQLEFSKDGLVNSTAFTRLSGSIRTFAYGYITEVDARTIRAVPYAIGDLVQRARQIPLSLEQEMTWSDIEQFSPANDDWSPTQKELQQLRDVPEKSIKALIAELLGEHAPKDWSGEESDLFSSNLLVRGNRQTGAFMLKGPARFHPMTVSDCGKNGDQIHRLFNAPADIYVVQHCHMITPAVRSYVEAMALRRAFVKPCHYVFIDWIATAKLLRANGKWPNSVNS